MSALPTNEDCEKIRKPPLVPLPDEELAELVTNNFRVLPIFENIYYEKVHRKYYSLQSNDYFRCCWTSYMENPANRKLKSNIDNRVTHFRNCKTQLVMESVHAKSDFRMKLKNGPGVDFLGEMPIPHEITVRFRNPHKPKAKGKENQNKKTENKDGG